MVQKSDVLFRVFNIRLLIHCRHLIGFFLFLSLTIYTAMKVPKVVDLHSLQLPEVLKADLHKLQECLPSLPNMPDLHKLSGELKSTLPSIDLLPSFSRWHVMDLLYNCLPERFSHSNQTDVCVLVMIFFLNADITVNRWHWWATFLVVGDETGIYAPVCGNMIWCWLKLDGWFVRENLEFILLIKLDILVPWCIEHQDILTC